MLSVAQDKYKTNGYLFTAHELAHDMYDLSCRIRMKCAYETIFLFPNISRSRLTPRHFPPEIGPWRQQPPTLSETPLL